MSKSQECRTLSRQLLAVWHSHTSSPVQHNPFYLPVSYCTDNIIQTPCGAIWLQKQWRLRPGWGYPSLPSSEVGPHPWLLQSLHLLSPEQKPNARGLTSRYHLSSAKRAKEVHSLRGWPSLCSGDASSGERCSVLSIRATLQTFMGPTVDL